MIFLTWLWLSALSLLLGAEINEVLAELRSERMERSAPELDGRSRPVGAIAHLRPLDSSDVQA